MPLPYQVNARGNRAAAVSGYHLSPNIWHDCPWHSIRNGEIAGSIIDLNFQQGGLITSPTTEAALVGLPLNGFGSAGSTITYADLIGGGIVLTEADDNEAVGIRTKTCPFQVSANLGKLWFEMRVKVNTIADNAMGFIAGLWDDVAMSVVVPLSTANPPIMATTGNFIGFRSPEEDAGSVNFVYDADDAGQTVDAEVIVQTGVHQFVADTFVNLGMVFDPEDRDRVNRPSSGDPAPGSPTLSSFVNNIRQLTTKTVPDATGTDFPADRRMGVMALIRMGATTAGICTIQWIRAAQLGV